MLLDIYNIKPYYHVRNKVIKMKIFVFAVMVRNSKCITLQICRNNFPCHIGYVISSYGFMSQNFYRLAEFINRMIFVRLYIFLLMFAA